MTRNTLVKLSIVIPTYNAATTLAEQLDALVASIDDDMEVIVVDNRSTDASRMVAANYAAKYPSVRVIEATECQGEPHARNIGVSAARSGSIAFCDADDVVTAGWASAMAVALQHHDYVTGPAELDRLNPTWLADFRGRRAFSEMPLTQYGIPFAHGCNFGVRKLAVDRLGGFDESVLIGCDIDFALRARQLGIEPAWVPDAMVHYRHRATTRQRWHQAIAFGRANHHLHQLCGLRDGWLERTRRQMRRVRWLLLSLPLVFRRSHRARWTWTLALAIGEVRGERG